MIKSRMHYNIFSYGNIKNRFHVKGSEGLKYARVGKKTNDKLK